MKSFNEYLEEIQEVGYVRRITSSVAHVDGLPSVRPSEVVMFENGQIGQVLALDSNSAEILLFFKPKFAIDTKVARTGQVVKANIDNTVLGKVINPLSLLSGDKTARPIEVKPSGISTRQKVTRPLETGVALVDLVIPLGMGQRELVIGDRKNGKTEFLQQIVAMQASRGLICVYAAIGKRVVDIKKIEAFFKQVGALPRSTIVATGASDPTGLIFLTPYVAMTIAEHFRDLGHDVLVILDDLTIHAKYYRELSLIAGRFPGRSSYPGDIFYIHSRLLERAGKFKKGSITAIPVAETVVSDISGYIQTNLMSMTDGHIFFDSDLYSLGRRPAINPFLSVTRVGKQTQTPLQRSITTQLTNFLVDHDKLTQYMHFGAELNEKIKSSLALGEKLYAFFNQQSTTAVPLNINLFILGTIWSGIWKDKKTDEIIPLVKALQSNYTTDKTFQTKIDTIIKSSTNFVGLINKIKSNTTLITQYAPNPKKNTK